MNNKLNAKPSNIITNPRMYFPPEVDEAIINYNSEPDPEIRSKIYYDKIHYSFFKLTQNIIHTFKFHNTDVEDLEDLQHEIIVYLMSKIEMFDASKGHKAFSYFGTIVKNYLILYTRKIYNNKISHIPIELLDMDYTNDTQLHLSESEKQKIQSQDGLYNETLYDKNEKLIYFIDRFVKYYWDHIEYMFVNKEDLKIADALFSLLSKRDKIPIIHKKAIYINLREVVDVKTPRITRVVNFIHNIFKEHYTVYINEGTINFRFDKYLL